jgi:hypothetical protein
LTRISLAKGKYGIIDLDAPLETSAVHPIGNKAAKARKNPIIDQQVPH